MFLVIDFSGFFECDCRGSCCKILAKMNDLMTQSFLNYVELKKQASKDIESELRDVERGQLSPKDEQNLLHFFKEVASIKVEMEEITNLLFDLQSLNEGAKTTHSVKLLRGLRDRMEADSVLVLRKAKTVKKSLEALDKSNITNFTMSIDFKEGSCVDRTRVSITNGLRLELRELMNNFLSLREKIWFDYKEDLRRRYYNATGDEPSQEEIEMAISLGGKFNTFEKAIDNVGVKERHDAVMDIQRSLTKLHKVFLDMAVLVDTQGVKLDVIEENVIKTGDYISGGTNSLYYANQLKTNNTQSWLYCVWAVMLVIIIVCYISQLIS